MDSADHFKKEVPCTMTELAEVLQTASDTAFTVRFHKKPNEDAIAAQIKSKQHPTKTLVTKLN
jgi:hypothetical protein